MTVPSWGLAVGLSRSLSAMLLLSLGLELQGLKKRAPSVLKDILRN